MFYTSEHTKCVEDDSERDPTNHADITGNHTYAHETRAHADSRQTCTAICSGPSRALPRKVCLRHDLFDIYFTAKTDIEPRQGGRFHIWHMLGRVKCLFATYALAKDGTFAARTAHYAATLHGSVRGSIYQLRW